MPKNFNSFWRNFLRDSEESLPALYFSVVNFRYVVKLQAMPVNCNSVFMPRVISRSHEYF
jgi:hypothetical protein